MSCQPRPHPQASGTAASSARNGTPTKTAIRIRAPVALGSGSKSPGAMWLVLAFTPTCPEDAAGLCFIAVLSYDPITYPYVTISYGTVGRLEGQRIRPGHRRGRPSGRIIQPREISRLESAADRRTQYGRRSPRSAR